LEILTSRDEAWVDDECAVDNLHQPNRIITTGGTKEPQVCKTYTMELFQSTGQYQDVWGSAFETIPLPVTLA
jgi:hypothetical protein